MNERSAVCVLYTVHLSMILHLNKAGMLAIFDFVDRCDQRPENCSLGAILVHVNGWAPERFQKMVSKVNRNAFR